MSKHPGLVTVAMSAAFLVMGMKKHVDFERAGANVCRCYDTGVPRP